MAAALSWSFGKVGRGHTIHVGEDTAFTLFLAVNQGPAFQRPVSASAQLLTGLIDIVFSLGSE
jgi:hypothetical protein